MSDGGAEACGGTVWLTGLPSAGKSTIADGVAQVLRGRGLRVQVLDGDAVRAELCADLGFSRADRDANVRRIGWAARLLAAHGVVVLVPVIAPFADVRREVRARHEEDGVPFVEVHVDTPLEECALRDVKGLYARQRVGDLRGLTGVDDPYEVPAAPELRVITVGRSVEDSVREVVGWLVEHRVGPLGAPTDGPGPARSGVARLRQEASRTASRTVRACAVPARGLARLGRAPGEPRWSDASWLWQPGWGRLRHRRLYRTADPYRNDASPFQQRKYARIVELLGEDRVPRLLEVGCSEGALSVRLAPRADEFVGVDLSRVAVERARRRVPSATFEHRVLPADMPDGTFDVIVVADVLYYWEPLTLQVGIRALLDRLRPGGRLIACHYREDFGQVGSADVVHRTLRAEAQRTGRRCLVQEVTPGTGPGDAGACWDVVAAPGGEASAPDRATPSVSVCIPVHQGREFLARTVRSVLDQTYSDFELVIRDNGSTDGTADVVRSFADPRVRLHRSESTVPLTESFDRAVRLARGDLVKVVCADDVLLPRCLELQVAALAADPGLALVAGRVDLIDGDDRVLTSNRLLRHVVGRIGSDDVVRRVVRHGGNPIGPPASVMFRRADYEAVGGVRDREQFTLDISLWARLLVRGDFLGQTESVAAFRVRSGTVTGTAGRKEFTVQRAFTTALARDASWSRHPGDLAVSLVGARTARARRQMLFAAAAVLSRLGHDRRPEGAARS